MMQNPLISIFIIIMSLSLKQLAESSTKYPRGNPIRSGKPSQKHIPPHRRQQPRIPSHPRSLPHSHPRGNLQCLPIKSATLHAHQGHHSPKAKATVPSRLRYSRSGDFLLKYTRGQSISEDVGRSLPTHRRLHALSHHRSLSQAEIEAERHRLARLQERLTERIDINSSRLTDEEIQQHVQRIRRRGEATARELEKLLESVSKEKAMSVTASRATNKSKIG